jgi:Resolvase, N terminal domain
MSTEHQKYSTENQADIIRQYAAKRGIEIVRTYADEGKSGLKLDGRDALMGTLANPAGPVAYFASTANRHLKAAADVRKKQETRSSSKVESRTPLLMLLRDMRIS